MRKINLTITVLALSAALTTTLGCRGGAEKQKDEFFTSGSREADQRAQQRIAKDQQLAGPEKNVKKAEKSEKPEAAGGTSGDPKAAQAEGKLTLYERLGGEKGITAIVDDFTVRALEDPRVNWQRRGVKRTRFFGRDESAVIWNATPENVEKLKTHLAQFLALATGGPPQYDGKEIAPTHAGMRISNPEFDAVIGDLKASLDKRQIPSKEQKELLAIIETTRPQIVTER